VTDRRRLAPYLRALADRMGLRDWTVCLLDAPPDDPNHGAENDCRYGRKRVNVCVNEAFLGQPPEAQRETIVHELVHAHMAPMHLYLHRVLDDHEFEAYRLAMEYAVDGIAEALALHMPLPPGPRKR
jgi:hypothetical protein